METTRHIKKELERIMTGQPWYGSPIRDVLNGIDAKSAAARPIANAHTIWEILLHMTAWKIWVRRALDGETKELTPAEDWAKPGETSEPAWSAAVETFMKENQALITRIGSFPEERIAEKVAGKEFPYWFLLHGVIQHDLYHAGQIGLLKKALSSSPK